MYLPAKFKIRFLEPVDLSAHGEEDADDVALVQPSRRRSAAGSRASWTRCSLRVRPFGSVRVQPEDDREREDATRPRGSAGGHHGRGARRAVGTTTSRTSRAPRCRSNLTGVVQSDKVTVSPAKVGGGPVIITIANQTDDPHEIILARRLGERSVWPGGTHRGRHDPPHARDR